MSGIISDNVGRSSGLVKEAGGGAWVLIGTEEAPGGSGTATLDVSGLNSTYDTFAVQISDLVPIDDDVDLFLRLGDGSIYSGATDYSWAVTGSRASDTDSGSAGLNFTAQDNQGAQIVLATDCSVGGATDVGNAAGEGTGFMLFLHGPGDGTVRPHIGGVGGYWSADTTTIYYPLFSGGGLRTVIDLERIQVLFSAGYVETGRLTVWGISHA